MFTQPMDLPESVSRRTSFNEWRTWEGFARCNIGLLKEMGSRYNSWSTLNGGILVFKSFPGRSGQSDDLQDFYVPSGNLT